jgi:hypothetical protein
MNDLGGTPTRLRAIPGDMYLRDLTAQDVIDRLWLVAQDRALDDGIHYAYR